MSTVGSTRSSTYKEIDFDVGVSIAVQQQIGNIKCFKESIDRMSHYMKAEKKQFVRSTQDYIIRPLLRQRETGELCDILLKLNGKVFNAHRAILALWSPYFLSMFTCDMREKFTKEIDLSESLVLESEDNFGCVLDYMYTGVLTLTIYNIEDILRISDFLLLDDVKDYCRQFYLDLGNLDLSNCLRVRGLAENHNLPEVFTACQKIVESRFHDYLIFHDEILELPASYFFKLFEEPKAIQHTSYIELRKLVQKWIDYDKDNRISQLDELSKHLKECRDDLEYATGANGTFFPQKQLSEMKEDLYCEFQSSNPHPQSTECAAGKDNNNVADEIHLSYQSDLEVPVLFAVVCNQGMKFFKLLIYNILERKWHNFPLTGEKVLQLIPPRQTVCNMLAYDNQLFMYLCSSFPYPTDMLKINILMIDLLKAHPVLYSFRTVDLYNPCYRTTLTNYRTVPPAMLHCNHHLFIVGNKEGTGHLFLLNMNNQQYTCYQIPGCRFISLARATAKEDRHIFLWYRHRTGPSEEFCIKKAVSFAVFDVKTRIFKSWEISPPDISYDDFAKPYTLCVRDDMVLIYHPGKPALVLDEVRCRWIMSLRKVPTTPAIDLSTEAYGYQIQASTKNSVLILNNNAPFTTSLLEIKESHPQALVHIPPPIDHISLSTAGKMQSSLLQQMDRFDRYDEMYATALHVTMRFSDGDTEDSAASHSEDQDSDDYEYDEDIYDYVYGFEAEFGF